MRCLSREPVSFTLIRGVYPRAGRTREPASPSRLPFLLALRLRRPDGPPGIVVLRLGRGRLQPLVVKPIDLGLLAPLVLLDQLHRCLAAALLLARVALRASLRLRRRCREHERCPRRDDRRRQNESRHHVLPCANPCRHHASTYSAMLVDGGTGKPSSRRPSTWKRIAARISFSTAAMVSPVATHPRRSGT